MNPPIQISEPPAVKFWDVFLVFVGALVAQLIVYGLCRSFEASLFLSAILAGTVNDLCWLGGYQALSPSRGWHNLQSRFAPVEGKVILGGVAGAIALIIFMMTLASALIALGVKITGTPDSGISAADLRHFPIALLFIVFIGPAAEELMFRGLLLDWLRQKIAPGWAVVLISLLFAAVHGHSFGNGLAGLLALLDRFLIGVATSYLALRYDSLRPAFVLHATNNTLAAFVLVMLR
jgi:membrane protease YdiL (CAAX protease family)